MFFDWCSMFFVCKFYALLLVNTEPIPSKYSPNKKFQPRRRPLALVNPVWTTSSKRRPHRRACRVRHAVLWIDIHCVQTRIGAIKLTDTLRSTIDWRKSAVPNTNSSRPDAVRAWTCSCAGRRLVRNVRLLASVEQQKMLSDFLRTLSKVMKHQFQN
jgi:hypothetical protein